MPAGTQSGTVLRLKGKGLPRLGQSGTGDLHVRVHVWTPEHLTEEQVAALPRARDPRGRAAEPFVRALVARSRRYWAHELGRRSRCNTAPESRGRLGAWLVEQTGHAIEERDDGTLVAYAGTTEAAGHARPRAARIRRVTGDGRAPCGARGGLEHVVA